MLSRLNDLLKDVPSDSESSVSITVKKEERLVREIREYEAEKDDDLRDYMNKFDKLKFSIDKINDAANAVGALEEQSNMEEVSPEEIGRQLDLSVNKVKEIYAIANEQMKQAQKSNKIFDRQNPNSSALIIRKNMIDSQARLLSRTMAQFNDQAEQFRQSLREKIRRRALAIDATLTPEEIDDLVDANDTVSFIQDQLENAHPELVKRVAELEEKRDGIKRIERGVREIFDLMKDLAFLVEEQGKCLDNIEERVGSTVDYVHEGVEALKKADLQRKKRHKQKILAIKWSAGVGCGLLVAAGCVYLYFKHVA
eukprot:202324_1